MDDDDEMVMIIVGDAGTDQVIKEEASSALCNKSELDLNAILETAETHGEYITLDEDIFSEYLDPGISTEQNLPKPIHTNNHEAPDDDCDDFDDDNEGDEDDGDEANLISKDPKKQISYIAQLRRNFPKMRKDEEHIILHLSEMMRQTKPPPPPPGIADYVDGKFVCTYCDIVSVTEPAANRHYQKKHGARYLVCYACGADFKCTTGLYKHEMVCQGEDACVVLKARGRYLGRKGRRRPFLSLNKFDPHNRSSHDAHSKALNICSLCPATFTHKEGLLSHELMHRGLRPYRCDRCPYAYTSPVALKRHLEKHTDIEFICDVCGRSFKSKNTLITHMNTHLPLRKYPCDSCERRFAQKNALQHHINRDHLNIPPPFACASCSKRFPRMSNLKVHMKAKHGLTLMTRGMFMKALPSMKYLELKQAAVVFNDPDTKLRYAPLRTPIFDDTNKEGLEADTEIRKVTDTNDESENIDAETGEVEEILGTIDDHTQETKYTYYNEESEDNVNVIVEVRNMPDDAIVRTSLEENVEIEFVKLIENGEFYSSNVTSGDTQEDNFTYRSKDKDSTSDNMNSPSNIHFRHVDKSEKVGAQKLSDITKTDAVVSDRNEIVSKFVKNRDRNGGPKKPNIKSTIQTRSGVMKTRSGTHINGNVIAKRGNLLRR